MPRPEALTPFLSQAVPRYTSYPTAPQFHEGVNASDYRAWLATLAPEKPISLYLHVPFCRQLCWYCGCNMKLAARDEPLAVYTNTLLTEIKLLTSALPARMPVSHIHWGGGTPTALTPQQLSLVMETVQERFEVQPAAEIAIEADPRTLSDEMIKTIGALGFNRASFGVQEFDETVQKAINRIQPPEMVERAVLALRGEGVNAINFDLIYGLPHQTTKTLQTTIEKVADMTPDRVSLFGYAHVPWIAKKQRMIDEAALPGAKARLKQARWAGTALIEAGYNPIGLDHFARPHDPLSHAAISGRLHRNFQGYTTDEAETLLGIGASAIGKTPNGYIQNFTETRAWDRAVSNGEIPIAKGFALSTEDRARAAVIEAIMCYGRVDLNKIKRKYDRPASWGERESESLQPLVSEGFLKIYGQVVSVMPKGQPLLRVIASQFDEYLKYGSARHSKAV